MPSYPIELNLQGKTAVVVGLGPVGRRKAAGLIEAGARVVGVDSCVIENLNKSIEFCPEPYRAEHLRGASLVVAAATLEVNRRVVSDAKSLGIWVNSASDPSAGDFTLPATYRDGPITLTVSTGGASPALATTLRDRAAGALGPEASGLASVLVELRAEVMIKTADPDARRQALLDAADPRWLDHYATEGPEATRKSLRTLLGLE